MRAAPPASPRFRYNRYARSRAANNASASSSHQAAQLSPSHASGVSSSSRASSKAERAAAHRPSARSAQPPWSRAGAACFEGFATILAFWRVAARPGRAAPAPGLPPRRLHSQDEMAVAELVPAIAVLEGGPVAAREQLVSSGGAQEVEVRCLRLVQAGEQTVDRPEPSLRCHDEVSPALAGRDGAVGLRDCLERPDDGRPRGDHAPAPIVDCIDQPGGVAGNAEALGVGTLVALLRRDACVLRE